MLCLNVLYTRPRRKFAKIDRRPGTCSVVCAWNVTAGQVGSAQFLTVNASSKSCFIAAVTSVESASGVKLASTGSMTASSLGCPPPPLT